jgi:hypothetical protein
MTYIIYFIIGLFIGCALGVLAMCLMSVAGGGEDG